MAKHFDKKDEQIALLKGELIVVYRACLQAKEIQSDTKKLIRKRIKELNPPKQ